MRTHPALFVAIVFALLLGMAFSVFAQTPEEAPPTAVLEPETPLPELASPEDPAENDATTTDVEALVPVVEKEKTPPEWFGRFQGNSDDAVAEGSPTTSAEDNGLPNPMANLKILVVKAVMTLCLLCGLFILVAYFFRKYAANTPILAGPRLGKVLGKVYLNPKSALHFVQSGSRILVIGITRQQMNLITEFDAQEFEMPEEEEQDHNAPKEMPFVNALDAALQDSQHDEDDIRTLRGDIERLREHLRDTVRDTTE